MTRRIVAVAAIALMGGCDSTPTSSVENLGALHSGGVIFGSGHRSDSTTTSTTSENDEATAQEERGGVIFGSGH